MFDIAFAVPDSDFADSDKCVKRERHKIIEALEARVKELRSNFDPEAIGHSDTYEN